MYSKNMRKACDNERLDNACSAVKENKNTKQKITN